MTLRPMLNPFLAFAEGEEFLRDQLRGLSQDELARIVQRYSLPVTVDPAASTPAAIAEDIVRALCDARRPQRRGREQLRAG
jgi:hypothetical protein